MNNEILINMLKELSEKPTTELALQFMELTADNIIKDKEIDRLKGALQTHEILLKTNVEENNRLNNIINEFELYLNTELQKCGGGGFVEEFLDKLKELKDSDKE